MVHRILVQLKPEIPDVQGQKVAARIRSDLGLQVKDVRLIKVYSVQGLTEDMLQEVLQRCLLHDPVLHQVSLQPLARELDWILEVGYRPGVTDNEGRVAVQCLRNGLGLGAEHPLQVYTACQYLLQGELQEKDVQQMATDLLSNQLIEEFRFKSSFQWQEEPGFPVRIPEVSGKPVDEVQSVPLSGLGSKELEELSKEKILALSQEEMLCIQGYYQRQQVQEYRQGKGLPLEPTDAELEVLAQTWSEHCKHKIFNASIEYRNQDTGQRQKIDSLFNTYIQDSTRNIRRAKGPRDLCLSVFKDNAGVIRFDQDYLACIKVETHNSPSALDPYGGALTGIVGVNRDPMGTGLGANLICNSDVFCFASPFYQQELPPRLLHPRRVLEGVRKGVEHGGNQSGIPTVNGALVFDSRFLGKPLVFCGTVGLMPDQIQGRPSQEKQARPGDRIVMVGGRVGKDGIHGATFSSEALHAESPATAVQIGDPITQRKMYDFLMRARDLGLYNAITDNGAGGLSSSVGEMAQDTGGCEMDLSLVPLKYDGLMPWEILLSEAQERMTLAVPGEKLEQFLGLARQMDVLATDLGRFTDSGFFRVFFGSKPVAELDMHFLHHGLPQMSLQARWKSPELPCLEVSDAQAGDPGDLLLGMLGRLNICSKEYIIRQYDHEVQGGSVIKPIMGPGQGGPTDAAVLRPVLDRKQGLVLSNGICPKFSDLDTYWMMANALDEAVRNALAVGGDPRQMVGVDNFCWCDPVQSEKTPDGEYKLAQLVRANQALAHFCQGFGVPCISGKDSMKNDYSMQGIKISIPPTVLFSVLGIVPNVEKALSSDLKKPGDLIYILGRTRRELGGTELAQELGLKGAGVPEVDLLAARKRYRSLHQAMQEGLVNACHDLSDGGLGVAAAEMVIAGSLGASLDLEALPGAELGLSLTELLYSESPSRLLVTVPRHRAGEFEACFQGQAWARLGEVRQEFALEFAWQGKTYLRLAGEDLTRAWKATMDW
ncbi:MAG: phosphoribosylformylglycinamidine synthase subunit PurS [Thermodesulfobacteriota bacterium]